MLPYLPSISWYSSWLRHHIGVDEAPVMVPDPRAGIIRGAWGEQVLTVPIKGGRKLLGKAPFEALRLSEHDDWRHKHWQAITSAYGALPYFPYFKDAFAPIYLSGPIEHLSTLNAGLHRAFLNCSNLPELVRWLSRHPDTCNLRKRPSDIPTHISALELLFLHGPEMIFYI
ncbi:MAG: WbqC family protein [Muribaculaceae bacterium]|nr:WbqC family protein [Muribaculaceae bacterium]